MSARAVHLRINRLVVHDDGAVTVADLEAAIAQAIGQRLQAPAPHGPCRSLPESIAEGVLDHPRVTALVTPGER